MEIRLIPTVLSLLMLLTMEAAARQSTAAADERALSALVERWTAARGANDAEAMRPLFAEHVDRVALPGARVESTTRDEILTYFANGFKGAAKGTRAKSIAIRPVLLSDAAGLVDHTYEMYGADGAKIGVGHTTFVALKNEGTWRIVAVRYISAWPQAQVTLPASGR